MDLSTRDDASRLPSAQLSSAQTAATPPRPRPWRCRACGAVLALVRAAELHLRRGEVELWIAGSCRHRCRRCGTTNAIDLSAQGGAR